MKPWLREPLPYWLWLATCIVIGLMFAGGVWVYTRVQVARVDAIERLCLRDNDRARENIAFISKSAPRLSSTALRIYKVEPNCHAFAVQAANSPPPQPGAPAP